MDLNNTLDTIISDKRYVGTIDIDKNTTFDFNKLIYILKNRSFSSFIDFDSKFTITFNGREQQLFVRNIDSMITKYENYCYYYVDRLETRLIAEFKINDTFVNFLHLVRFYELKEIDLVEDLVISRPRIIARENNAIGVASCIDDPEDDHIRRIARECSRQRVHNRDNDDNHDDVNDDVNIDDEEKKRRKQLQKRIEEILIEALGVYIGSKNIIAICPELIEDTIRAEYRNPHYYQLYKEHLLEKVLYHEYGHAIFLYNGIYLRKKFVRNCIAFKEKQANYFASFAVMGKNDELISDMCAMQSIEYHNPMLYSQYVTEYNFFDNSNIKKLYIRDSSCLLNKRQNSKNNKGGKDQNYAMKAKFLILKALFESKIGKYEFNKLLDKNESYYLCNLAHPMLADASTSFDKARYHTSPDSLIRVFGRDYAFCNDWDSKKYNKLKDWIEKL